MELGALCPFEIRVLFAIPTQQKVNTKIQLVSTNSDTAQGFSEDNGCIQAALWT